MISQRDSWWWHKLNGATRQTIAKGYWTFFFQNVVVTEYPKSGGTWVSQMISEASGLPYARNRLPLLGPSILHGCWLNPSKRHTVLVLYRDGRDIMVSYYYHALFPKEITSTVFSNKLISRLGIKDPNDIDQYLPIFIDWAFTQAFPKWSWSDFIDRWVDDTTVCSTSYERLSQNPTEELTKIVQSLGMELKSSKITEIVQKYSFAAQSGRQPGQEDKNSFARKGIVGDWANNFTSESAELFQQFAGPQLIKAGYESNDDWVTKLTR